MTVDQAYFKRWIELNLSRRNNQHYIQAYIFGILSSDKCTHYNSLWIKASAKRRKGKCFVASSNKRRGTLVRTSFLRLERSGELQDDPTRSLLRAERSREQRADPITSFLTVERSGELWADLLRQRSAPVLHRHAGAKVPARQVRPPD